jgi:hypothetical protein
MTDNLPERGWMNETDWNLLKSLIGETLKTLRKGRNFESEAWEDMADDLDRASMMARQE